MHWVNVRRNLDAIWDHCLKKRGEEAETKTPEYQSPRAQKEHEREDRDETVTRLYLERDALSLFVPRDRQVLGANDVDEELTIHGETPELPHAPVTHLSKFRFPRWILVLYSCRLTKVYSTRTMLSAT